MVLGDCMERQILHIDVNNAFLSWSAIYLLNTGYEIDIRTIPSIIGGDESKRSGIVLAKSMLAKSSGIVTGEPIFFARKKCPGLKIYPGNYEIYSKFSNKLYKLLLEYTDKIERFSIDECFLDLTDALRNKDLYSVAEEIKNRVEKELGFTVNIGLSTNKVLAKMASDFEKPNKIHTLYTFEIQSKLWNLPISELFMLGRKSVPKLNNMNIKTIGDLAKSNKQQIISKFGKHGELIWNYANGIDDSEVNYNYIKPKGVGNSTTLSKDINTLEEISDVLLKLTEHVAYRLRGYNLKANVVSVQLRTSEFKDFSCQRKLLISTSSTKVIFLQAREILMEMYKNQPIRLVGVRVDKLVEEDEVQLSIFDEINKKQENIDKAVDNIKHKYGYSCIVRGGEGKFKIPSKEDYY